MKYVWLSQACFFNIFEKTQAQKNSRLQKTQGNFGSKLNEMVVMVVTQTLELIIFRDICAQTWPVTQNCPKQTEKWLFFAEILQILALKALVMNWTVTKQRL